MNVVVETADGLANICGDVIYDFQDQIIDPVYQVSWMEPHVTGNHAGSKRQEKAAIKKLLSNYRYLCPIHDKPALIENQQVVGRLEGQIPGPGHPVRAQARLVSGLIGQRSARSSLSSADRRICAGHSARLRLRPSPRGRSGIRVEHFLLFSDMPGDVRRRWDQTIMACAMRSAAEQQRQWSHL